MTAPDGPHPVSSKLQVRIPIRLANRLRIEPGDHIYWRASDDHPGTLELIPSEIVERRYSAGESLEKGAREVARELPHSAVDTNPEG
ncbi:MAG: AbrB/MazE/SpoVT family DNA-binding domain-containing protein [Mycolicibacterium vanbaalenii]|uniref:AbrB/MazE/SpoVT family DNA-binding domain-containing protein n=1 Tax=Mycolicibacterium vanbaalenii TaxID=110539 RepID=UPI003564E6F8